MDLPSILLAVVIMLGATALCVILFERLGFGSVLGLFALPVSWPLHWRRRDRSMKTKTACFGMGGDRS